MIISLFIGLSYSCKKKPADKTPPVISLLGAEVVYVDKGTIYNDAGAEAFDETDGNISDKITIYNPVDANTVGIYYVTYNVADKAGNKATEVKRKVEVKIF